MPTETPPKIIGAMEL
ncbi:unnamed protein product, partial [Rotaria socialis]